MITTIYNSQKDLSLSLATVKLAVPFLLRELNISTDEVIIHFVSKTRIAKVHDQFFADPTPTDCISFPMDEPSKEPTQNKHHILGEIFVCPKVAMEYALQHRGDPYQETLLYVIHGLLHLIGYDDMDPVSRRKMRRMEKKCLALCKPFSLSKKILS